MVLAKSTQTDVMLTKSSQTLSSQPLPYFSVVMTDQAQVAMAFTASSGSDFSQTISSHSVGVLLSPSPTHSMTHSGTTTAMNNPGSRDAIINLPIIPTPAWSFTPTVSDDRFVTPGPMEKNRYQSIGAEGIKAELVQAVYESQLEASGDQNNGQNGVDLVIVIVIGALLGVTSITTVIAIIAFSVVVALIRKKSSNQIIQGMR